jgi:DNA-binding response OmpR family regulator
VTSLAATSTNAPGASTAGGALADDASAPAGRAKTIVIIEDLEDLADVTKLLLAGEGYRVYTALDGYAGLRLAIERNADLVILDHLLPAMVGADVGRALRAHAQARRARIVMMSATPERDVREQFADYDAFLTKPCPPERLLEVIAAQLAGV